MKFEIDRKKEKKKKKWKKNKKYLETLTKANQYTNITCVNETINNTNELEI